MKGFQKKQKSGDDAVIAGRNGGIFCWAGRWFDEGASFDSEESETVILIFNRLKNHAR